MARFEMDPSEIDVLMQRIIDFGEGAEDAINNTFETFGVPEVEERITRLLPTSGRRWKGKKRAAKTSQPFTHKMENLSFVVRSKSAYNYLYFPDDGSNTKRHAGNQMFMTRGAESAQGSILDRCLAELKI